MGLFPDHASAEHAYESITDRGYGQDDLHLVMSHETRERCLAGHCLQTKGNKVAESAGVGGTIGGTLGAVAGAVAALGTSLLIPGLGIGVAGPLVAGLTGAGVGGITGGLAGALIGLGIPKEHVKAYEAGIKNGGVCMAVRPHNEQDAAFLEQSWRNNRGQHVCR